MKGSDAMNTMEVIHARRSVRKYTDKPVDKATVEKLIDSAVYAPTGMNAQPWVFGVIQNADILLDISNRTKAYLISMLEHMPALERYRDAFESADYNIFYGTSTLVLICAKPGVSPTPEVDCTLAAENLMLAACELGLGTCWIGFAQMYLGTPEAKQELGIPEDYLLIAPIIVGYPDGEPPAREKNPPEIAFWK